jgi:ribose-phosphate pyrophosphokinase
LKEISMNDRITLHDVYAGEREDLPCSPFTFSGGEPHVQLDPATIADRYFWVDARLATADGFLRTLAVLDAVRACRPKRLGLFLPYFPAARQDRRQPGTPFTLRIYTEALKRLSLDVIVTLDPHSDVLAACLDVEIIHGHQAMPDVRGYAGFIVPDAGAEKRVHAAARALNIDTVVHARKARNTRTGALTGFQCDPLPTAGRYLVVDDICDGGATFIGLAEAIKPDAATKLDLWVSHGIFSKGFDALLARFDRIHTTDSFPLASIPPASVHRTQVHGLAAAAMRRRIAS